MRSGGQNRGDARRRYPDRVVDQLAEVSRIRAFLRLVLIEHSVFALPFAYIAALTAMRSETASVHWWQLFLVTLAMVGLRTFAMACNRIIDRAIDARNPRTAGRGLVPRAGP